MGEVEGVAVRPFEPTVKKASWKRVETVVLLWN
jgi:hypothetical protein